MYYIQSEARVKNLTSVTTPKGDLIFFSSRAGHLIFHIFPLDYQQVISRPIPLVLKEDRTTYIFDFKILQDYFFLIKGVDQELENVSDCFYINIDFALLKANENNIPIIVNQRNLQKACTEYLETVEPTEYRALLLTVFTDLSLVQAHNCGPNQSMESLFLVSVTTGKFIPCNPVFTGEQLRSFQLRLTKVYSSNLLTVTWDASLSENTPSAPSVLVRVSEVKFQRLSN